MHALLCGAEVSRRTYYCMRSQMKQLNYGVVDETTNSHVNIDDNKLELLIIASIETLKCQNKKCGKDEVFALVKDSLEEAITMEIFDKSLALLQAGNSIKCNIISNRTCLSVPKHSSVPNFTQTQQ